MDLRNAPKCIYDERAREDLRTCYQNALYFLYGLQDQKDNPRTPLQLVPDDDAHSKEFVRKMLRPIEEFVSKHWEKIPSSLVAQRDPDEKINRFAPSETEVLENVGRLKKVSQEKEEMIINRKNAYLFEIEANTREVSGGVKYNLKGVVTDFMHHFIGKHRVRIMVSFILSLGHLFRCIYEKSGVKVDMLLKGGVCIRFWLFMLFDELPNVARNFAYNYANDTCDCLAFTDQDYHFLPVNGTIEDMRKVERLSYMTLVRLSSFWSTYRNYYFEFYSLQEEVKNRHLTRLLQQLNEEARKDTRPNLYKNFKFLHVVYEDQDGNNVIFPSEINLRHPQSLTAWPGYMGSTKRTSIIKIDNITKDETDKTDRGWDLYGAENFFISELSQGILSTNPSTNPYKDLIDPEEIKSFLRLGDDPISFVYSSYNPVCAPEFTKIFSLQRILANFTFLCNRGMNRFEDLLSNYDIEKTFKALDLTTGAKKIHIFETVFAIRLQGEIVDFANAYALPPIPNYMFKSSVLFENQWRKYINDQRKDKPFFKMFKDFPYLRSAVRLVPQMSFLRMSNIKLTNLEHLAHDQTRIIFVETGFEPWTKLREKKIKKRMCRLILLLTWCCVKNSRSREDYVKNLQPMQILHHTIQELVSRPNRMESSRRSLLFREIHGKGDDEMKTYFFNSMRQTLKKFESGKATKEKMDFFRTLLEILNFSLFLFFLFVGHTTEFENWARIVHLPNMLTEDVFKDIGTNTDITPSSLTTLDLSNLPDVLPDDEETIPDGPVSPFVASTGHLMTPGDAYLDAQHLITDRREGWVPDARGSSSSEAMPAGAAGPYAMPLVPFLGPQYRHYHMPQSDAILHRHHRDLDIEEGFTPTPRSSSSTLPMPPPPGRPTRPPPA